MSNLADTIKNALQDTMKEFPHKGLPLPRLQLTWIATPDEENPYYVSYDLILPVDEDDCRKVEGLDVITSNLGLTGVGMYSRTPQWEDGTLDTPYRDGSHIRWDSEVLGDLPMYVVWEGIKQKLK